MKGREMKGEIENGGKISTVIYLNSYLKSTHPHAPELLSVKIYYLQRAVDSWKFLYSISENIFQ